MASPASFGPAMIGFEQFIDGGFKANNPVNYALSAAITKWPDRPVTCLLSLGSGRRKGFTTSASGLMDISRLLTDIAIETERTADAFVESHRDMVDNGSYFRFNVNTALENIYVDSEFDTRLRQFRAATQQYLHAETAVSPNLIAECARRLAQGGIVSSEDRTIDLIKKGESGVSSTYEHSLPIYRADGAFPGPHETKERRDNDSIECSNDGPEPQPEQKVLILREDVEGVKIVANSIVGDFELKSLLRVAMSNIGKDRTAKNFKILLDDFARRLHQSTKFRNLEHFVSSKSQHLHIFLLHSPCFSRLVLLMLQLGKPCSQACQTPLNSTLSYHQHTKKQRWLPKR